MYKVFINQVLVFFSEAPYENNIDETVLYQEIDFQQFFKKILIHNRTKINIICKNLEKDWLSFQKHFKVRVAAGGWVKNQKQEYLWIYRLGKWDLPKGHVEKGESIEEGAIREVEEECGVTGLQIIKPMDKTYHMYEHKGKWVLKITHWFEMGMNFEGKLIPQTEEGIEEVVCLDKEESKKCLQNTYGNIKLLVGDFL